MFGVLLLGGGLFGVVIASVWGYIGAGCCFAACLFCWGLWFGWVDLWLLLCFGGLLADLGLCCSFDGLLFDGWCWFVGYWFVDIVWLLLFVIVVVDITVMVLRLVGLGGRVLITLLLLVCWLRCCLFGFC